MFQLFFPAIVDIDFQLELIILGVRQEQYSKEIKHFFAKNKNISVEIPDKVNWQDEMSVYERVKEFDMEYYCSNILEFYKTKNQYSK